MHESFVRSSAVPLLNLGTAFTREPEENIDMAKRVAAHIARLMISLRDFQRWSILNSSEDFPARTGDIHVRRSTPKSGQCRVTLLCLWILQAFERHCDRSIWQSTRIFRGWYVLRYSLRKAPMFLLLFRRARPLKSRLHRADSQAYTDLCLCDGVGYLFFQRWSSRLQCGLPGLEGTRLERNTDAEGEKEKRTNFYHTIFEIPLAANSTRRSTM